MPRRLRPVIEQLIALLVLSVAGGSASADELHDHGKHVHGEVTVNIAVDGRALALEIDAPAAQALGFEKSPRDDRERAAVKAVDDWFRSGRNMLGVPPAAGCRLTKTEFTPPKLGSGHADYRGRYLFDCAAPQALAWVEVWALRRMQGLEETEVNLITSSGQRQETLRDGAVRITLR
ncbi:MAG: DUF2796 domain-containing protein [Gammaproteobacteria bacterium]